MLSKEELLEKNVSELEEIAQQTGAVYSPGDDKDKLVYAILDRQAEEVGTAHPLESKRKRTRIARKETDRVYSVHGKNGKAQAICLPSPSPSTMIVRPPQPCGTVTHVLLHLFSDL